MFYICSRIFYIFLRVSGIIYLEFVRLPPQRGPRLSAVWLSGNGGRPPPQKFRKKLEFVQGVELWAVQGVKLLAVQGVKLWAI